MQMLSCVWYRVYSLLVMVDDVLPALGRTAFTDL